MADLKDQMIINHILESEDKLLAAYECNRVYRLAIHELVERRVDKVRTALEANIGFQTFTCETNVQPLLYGDILACSDSSLENVKLYPCIHATKNDLGTVFIGIRWRDDARENKSPELEKQIFSFFNKEIHQGKTIIEMWPWYTELRDPWNGWNNAQALKALLSDELTEPENDLLELCSRFKEFFAAPHE
ncbi:MAG: hypothetical protein FWG97_02530 [Deltaproteobacteria bacterium]|nr:hypothetical protein [Deltaproteobacteria bacterium]